MYCAAHNTVLLWQHADMTEIPPQVVQWNPAIPNH